MRASATAFSCRTSSSNVSSGVGRERFIPGTIIAKGDCAGMLRSTRGDVMAVRAGDLVDTADQRVVMHGVPWSHYEAQLALRGDVSGPRMSYLEGDLEIMSPSRDHERIKSYIGRLIEAYALETGLDLSPYGGWTLKNPARKSG